MRELTPDDVGGAGTLARLQERGVRSLTDLALLTDEELLAVPGLGRGKLAHIRDVLDRAVASGDVVRIQGVVRIPSYDLLRLVPRLRDGVRVQLPSGHVYVKGRLPDSPELRRLLEDPEYVRQQQDIPFFFPEDARKVGPGPGIWGPVLFERRLRLPKLPRP